MGQVIDDILKDPKSIGVITIMVIAVFAMFKGLVVPAWVLTRVDSEHAKVLADRDAQIVQLRKDCDEFKALAFRATSITEQTQRVRSKAFDAKG